MDDYFHEKVCEFEDDVLMKDPKMFDYFFHDFESLCDKLVIFFQNFEFVKDVSEDELDYFYIFQLACSIDNFFSCGHEAFFLMFTN